MCRLEISSVGDRVFFVPIFRTMSVRDSPMRAAPKQGPDCNLQLLGDSVGGDSVGRSFTTNDLMRQSQMCLQICMGRFLMRVGAGSIANHQINCPFATISKVSAQHGMLELVPASKINPQLHRKSQSFIYFRPPFPHLRLPVFPP